VHPPYFMTKFQVAVDVQYIKCYKHCAVGKRLRKWPSIGKMTMIITVHVIRLPFVLVFHNEKAGNL